MIILLLMSQSLVIAFIYSLPVYDITLNDHFVYEPSQWGTTLQCYVFPHCLAAYIKWPLNPQGGYNGNANWWKAMRWITELGPFLYLKFGVILILLLLYDHLITRSHSTHKQLEILGCAFNTGITDALGLKYTVDKIFVMYDFVQKYSIFNELCEIKKIAQLLWVKII